MTMLLGLFLLSVTFGCYVMIKEVSKMYIVCKCDAEIVVNDYDDCVCCPKCEDIIEVYKMRIFTS